MVIILPQWGQLQNYLKGDLAELENYLWARVESKRSKPKTKKKLAEEHTCTCTDGKKLDGILVGYHAFIHHFISSYAFLLSCGKDGTYSSKFAWSPLFFYTVFLHSLGISRFAKCIQRDLWSSFEFEVQFWQACVYLKTFAKQLQCLLSLSALLAALRLFNGLVSLS